MAKVQVALPEVDIQQPKRWLQKKYKEVLQMQYKGLFLCAECYATHVLDADTYELNHQQIGWSIYPIFLIYVWCHNYTNNCPINTRVGLTLW